MKLLFLGDLSGNNGPANVNKYLQKYSNFDFINTKKVYKNYWNNMRLFLSSDVIVISGLFRGNFIMFKIAKVLGKKSIYLMHGYSAYEEKINNMKNAKRLLKTEEKVLNDVDLILPVSSKYRDFFLKFKPKYKNKTHYLTNGLDTNSYPVNIKPLEKRKNNIIVCGGNRNIKCNNSVAKAIEILNRKGFACTLSIYGSIYDNNEKIVETDNVKIFGCIPQKDLFQKMSESKLFILNTKTESFGLSAFDALMCGCNLLISKKAGITSLMELEEQDIINDENDELEIANKIERNLIENNSSKILKSINVKENSWANVSKRLESIAKRLYSKENVKVVE